jgi:hypothetical protein
MRTAVVNEIDLRAILLDESGGARRHCINQITYETTSKASDTI